MKQCNIVSSFGVRAVSKLMKMANLLLRLNFHDSAINSHQLFYKEIMFLGEVNQERA